MTVPNGNVYKVHLADPGGRVTVLEIPTEDFEATDRGVALRNTIVPWHRVLRYTREMTSPVDEALRSHAEMRLWVDDGSDTGETLTIRADRFEAGPYTVDVQLERALLVEAGVYHLTKVHVPWARVLEYERLPMAARVPSRPD